MISFSCCLKTSHLQWMHVFSKISLDVQILLWICLCFYFLTIAYATRWRLNVNIWFLEVNAGHHIRTLLLVKQFTVGAMTNPLCHQETKQLDAHYGTSSKKTVLVMLISALLCVITFLWKWWDSVSSPKASPSLLSLKVDLYTAIHLCFPPKAQQKSAFDIWESRTRFRHVLSDGCMNHGPVRDVD